MREYTFPFWFIGFVGGLIMGLLLNLNSGYQEATKSTTIFCVEKPKECKIRYDYYKLEDKTK